MRRAISAHISPYQPISAHIGARSPRLRVIAQVFEKDRPIQKTSRRDRLSAAQQSVAMSRVKSRDTKPEIVLRSALHARGLRFRVHVSTMTGRPDIVLPRWQAAIFVHGCFWHGHACARGALPSSNTKFWIDKIARNKARDAAQITELMEQDWRVGTVWQCSLFGKECLGATRAAGCIHEWLESNDNQLVLSGSSVDSSH